jgi:hypothetical protein
MASHPRTICDTVSVLKKAFSCSAAIPGSSSPAPVPALQIFF